MCQIGLICINSLPFCIDEIARLRLAIQFYEDARLLVSTTNAYVSNTNDAYVTLQARIFRELNDAYLMGYSMTGNQTYLKQATVTNQQALSFQKNFSPHTE